MRAAKLTEIEQIALRVHGEADPLEQARVPKERTVLPLGRNEERGIQLERFTSVRDEADVSFYEFTAYLTYTRRQRQRLALLVQDPHREGDLHVEHRPCRSGIELRENWSWKVSGSDPDENLGRSLCLIAVCIGSSAGSEFLAVEIEQHLTQGNG